MFVQNVVRARSEVEAAWLIYESKPGTRLIAGGTDLMLQMWRGHRQASALVDLRRSGMDHIIERDSEVLVGSTASIAAIAHHPGIHTHFPDLHQAAAIFASQQIRNMATIGGNIGNASPAADLVAPLIAHAARIRVRRGDELREVAIDDFFTGPGQHVLSQQEIVTEVILPKPQPGGGRHYCRFLKLGFRGAQVIAVVNLAIDAVVRGGIVEDTRIALGAVAPTVVRGFRAERILVGATLARDSIVAATDALAGDIAPIDDVRAPAEYRSRVARNFLRLALEEISVQHAAE